MGRLVVSRTIYVNVDTPNLGLHTLTLTTKESNHLRKACTKIGGAVLLLYLNDDKRDDYDDCCHIVDDDDPPCMGRHHKQDLCIDIWIFVMTICLSTQISENSNALTLYETPP